MLHLYLLEDITKFVENIVDFKNPMVGLNTLDTEGYCINGAYLTVLGTRAESEDL